MASEPRFELPKLDLPDGTTPQDESALRPSLNSFQLPKLDLAQPVDPSRFTLPRLELPTGPASTSDLFAPVKTAPSTRKQDAPLVESKFKSNPVSNFFENSWRIVKGLAEFAFVSTPTHLHDLAVDPEKYADDVKKWWSANGEALPRQLWETTFGRYFKGGVEDALAEIWNNPADFLLDLTLVGGAAANLTGKVGKVAQLMGAADKGTKLIRYGKNLSNLSNAVDPFVASGRLLSRMGGPVLEAVGIGEHTKPLLALRETEYAQQSIEKIKNLRRVMSEELAEAEARALDRAISVGAEADIAALTPKARERYSAWREIVADQEQNIRRRDLVAQDRMDAANAKRAAVYLDVPEDVARQMMKDGKIRPTFASMYRIEDVNAKGFMERIASELTGDIRRAAGKAARLEKRVGTEAFERDPRVYMMKQITLYHEMNKRLRWLDRVKDYLQKHGALKVLPTGSEAKGFEPIPETLFKKYYEDVGRVASMTVDEIASGAHPLAAAESVARKLVDDSNVGLHMKGGHSIYVPKHVASLINQEMRIPPKLMRWYMGGLRRWKSAATVFRPPYWLGQALGNGMLGVLAGATPSDWIRGRLLRDVLPAPLRSAVSTGEMSNVAGLLGKFDRISSTFHEYASVFDDQLRRTLFGKGVEQARLRLLDTGNDFFRSLKALRDPKEFGRVVSLAPEELSDIVVKVARAQEEMARAVSEIQTLRKQLEALSKRADDLSGEYGALMDQEVQGGVTFREKQIRQKIAALEADATKLAAGEPGAVEAAKLAVRQIRQGRSGLRRELATVMRRQTMASVSDLAEVLNDIRKRGGIRPTTATQRELPKALRAKRDGGIRSDELAQEFADRGIIADASLDALYDFVEKAGEAISSTKASLSGIKSQARTAATGKLNEAIDELIQNTRERVKLKNELREMGRQKTAGTKELDVISKERRAKLAEKEKEIKDAQAAAATVETAIKDKEAALVEKIRSTGELQRRVPELEQLSKVADDGIQLGNRFVGSYARLHPMERDWFRAAVPFFVFTKAMTMLAARLPFLYPGKTFFWHHFTDMINDVVRDDEMPSWAQQYIPIAAMPDGSILMTKLASANPFGGVKVGSMAEHSIPRILDVFNQNPIMKVFVDMSGGTPSWSKKPLSPGEYATRLDNGEVYKFTGDGFKRIIPQPSIWKAIWNTFPQAQMIDSFFSPHVQTDRGWAGSPDPIRNGTGEPLFPRDWMERYLSFLNPVRTIDPKEEKLKERRRIVRVMRSFRDDLRRASPEQREQISEVMRSWWGEKFHQSIQD